MAESAFYTLQTDSINFSVQRFYLDSLHSDFVVNNSASGVSIANLP
jgi:hypothetical protein